MPRISNGAHKRAWRIRIRKYVWPASIWRKILNIFIAIVIVFTGSAYGVAQWYILKHSHEPLVLGTTFIPAYAESFGLDSKEALNAIFADLNIKMIRFTSYWDRIEPNPSQYDFSELDWQFAMANAHGAKVSLAIGLRQPRWPECHEPSWAFSMPNGQWQPKLYQFMKAVIDRYKDNPALNNYELENEFFMKIFGECKDFDRSRLVEEFKMVKNWDPQHKVIISRSNNWIGIPVREPTPDEFGISVYKRVWDKTITKRYFEYPLPPWFYAFLAGAGELVSGKGIIIHELQAEPWTPQDIHFTAPQEMYKSMNAQRMKDRIAYGEATGIRTIDLWGAEWWYWLKTKNHDSSVWDAVKQAVVDADADNQKLAAEK